MNEHRRGQDRINDESAARLHTVGAGDLTGTPAKCEPGEYARRVRELSPMLGMALACARADMEMREARAALGVMGTFKDQGEKT